MKWLVDGALETNYRVTDNGYDTWLETSFQYSPKSWGDDEEGADYKAEVIEVGDEHKYYLRVHDGYETWFAPLVRVMSDVTEAQKWGLIETEADLERVVKAMDEGSVAHA